MSISIYK